MNKTEIIDLTTSIVSDGYKRELFSKEHAALMIGCAGEVPGALEKIYATNYDFIASYLCEAGLFLNFVGDGELVTIVLAANPVTDEDYDNDVPMFGRHDFTNAISITDSIMKLNHDTELFAAIESTVCVQLGAREEDDNKIRLMGYMPNLKMLLDDLTKNEIVDLLDVLLEGFKDARA